MRRMTILIAKAHAKNVKVLVSICGGSESENKTSRARYYNLLTEPKRADFAAKLADIRQRITASMDWTWTSKGPRSTRITGRSSTSYPPR